LPSWTNVTIDLEVFDMAPNGEQIKTPECHSQQELLETFDANVAKGREALAGVSDERIFGNWALAAGGHQIFSLPRVAVLRSFVLNHITHHRAQQQAYLPLNADPAQSLSAPPAD